MADKTKVDIYTDGACSGNPGPGGWGAILKCAGVEKELCGGEPDTTNNRMELMAVISAFEALKRPCKVTLHSDSKYIIDAIEQGWAVKWRENGWMRNKREKALNPDLWSRLLDLLEVHEVDFEWIKGHNGHPENERCDKMAVEQSQKYVKI
ncbi:MAG: ribonuclease HI [Oscillospiraceae bacterium]|nr:ribonuclease HI [Oscillospiraceae bacterium]